MTVEFIESSHTYLVDGVIVPSVTQIIKSVSDDVYNGIPQHILEKAAQRGTIVHQAIHDYETHGRINPDVPIEYLNHYRKIKLTTGLEPLRQEFILTDGEVAGTIDMLAKIGDKTVLIDWKTSASEHRDLWAIQLAGYDALCRFHDIKVDEHYIGRITEKLGKLVRIEPDHDKWKEMKDEALRIVRSS